VRGTVEWENWTDVEGIRKVMGDRDIWDAKNRVVRTRVKIRCVGVSQHTADCAPGRKKKGAKTKGRKGKG